jgi:hypothetical protein
MIRFTIRDALWLTVVVALVTAWLLDHRQQARNYSALLRASDKLWDNVRPNKHEAALYGRSPTGQKLSD